MWDSALTHSQCSWIAARLWAGVTHCNSVPSTAHAMWLLDSPCMDLGSSLAVGHGSTVHLSGQGLDHCLVMCFESTSQLLLPVPLGWRAPGQQETQITRIRPLCVSEQWLSRVQVIAQSSSQTHPAAAAGHEYSWQRGIWTFLWLSRARVICLVLQETPWAAAGKATGVQQRRIEAQGVMDVLLTVFSPPQESEECWKGGVWEG